VSNLTQISLINYPGKVAATLFFPGCNFRCGYCHNPDLVNNKKISEQDYFSLYYSYVKRKKPYISGVCITGGEPLLNYSLVFKLAKRFKEMGLSVKLDTNGYFPNYIEKLLTFKLVDYIAMDIKSSQKNYSKITGRKIDISKINKSIKIIKKSRINYEFRSTVIPRLYSNDDAHIISKWLKGSHKYVLQSFSNKAPTVASEFQKLDPYPLKEMEKLKAIMDPYFQIVELR
tara:strand:- start:923 stop:1612 length:690 start_codon:yes stop_codon:yes gene_type:complete